MNRSMKFKRTVDTNPFSLAARGKFDKQSISSLSLSLSPRRGEGARNEGGKKWRGGWRQIRAKNGRKMVNSSHIPLIYIHIHNARQLYPPPPPPRHFDFFRFTRREENPSEITRNLERKLIKS